MGHAQHGWRFLLWQITGLEFSGIQHTILGRENPDLVQGGDINEVREKIRPLLRIVPLGPGTPLPTLGWRLPQDEVAIQER